MDPHARYTDIRCDGEEGKPQVLYLGVLEHLLYQRVEAKARHHTLKLFVKCVIFKKRQTAISLNELRFL